MPSLAHKTLSRYLLGFLFSKFLTSTPPFFWYGDPPQARLYHPVAIMVPNIIMLSTLRKKSRRKLNLSRNSNFQQFTDFITGIPQASHAREFSLAITPLKKRLQKIFLPIYVILLCLDLDHINWVSLKQSWEKREARLSPLAREAVV